jgi:hypothetical protein
MYQGMTDVARGDVRQEEVRVGKIHSVPGQSVQLGAKGS